MRSLPLVPAFAPLLLALPVLSGPPATKGVVASRVGGPAGFAASGPGLGRVAGSAVAAALAPASTSAPPTPAGAEPQRASGSRKGKGQGKGKGKGKKGKRSISGRPFGAGVTLPGLGPGLGLGPTEPAIPAPPTLDDFGRAPEVAPEDGDQIVVEPVDPVQLEEWFSLADYDGTTWVSFREARSSMEFGRDRFAHYDTDRDGRLRADEFEAWYQDCIRLGGAFVPPKGPPGPKTPPQRTPQQLRNAYDIDLDGSISLFELGRLLVDYGQVGLDANDVLRLVDSDRDNLLGVDELVSLAGILHPVLPPPDEETAETLEGPRPTTILELFGQVEQRGTDIGGTPYPPRIVGPVPIFRRLDLDGDGAISTTDLSELMRPIQLGFRPHAVLGTLDLDGDGALSPEEFERAMVGDPWRD